jgi:hypothetical protein
MRWVTLAGILVALAASAGAAQAAPAAGCTALSGTFKAVPNSAGAGNIVYALRLRNGGPASCVIKGLPALRLLGKSGKALPTHVVRDPRFPTSPTVALASGKTATAKARFSPDVPGPGEPAAAKHCEPVAYRAKVLFPGSANFTVPISPATSVCEHGTLTVTPYR